jgi:hypothetical protein
MRQRPLVAHVSALFVWSVSATLHAYPSSVVFAPTGEARELGGYYAFSYGSVTLRAPDRETGGYSTQLGPTWIGGAFGVAPSFAYAEGFRFGGLELGASLSSPDILGRNRIMPTFDGKLAMLVEATYSPSIAVGVLGLSTVQPFTMAYVSMTKTLQWGGPSWGRLTLGGGRLFVPRAELYPDCTAPGQVCAYRGSPPLADGTNFMPLLGYESPSLGPLNVAIDHVGGTSFLSSTNVVANLKTVEGAYFTLGMAIANDRRNEVTKGAPPDALFVMFSLLGNVMDVFSSAKGAPTAPVSTSAPSTH